MIHYSSNSASRGCDDILKLYIDYELHENALLFINGNEASHRYNEWFVRLKRPSVRPNLMSLCFHEIHGTQLVNQTNLYHETK